MTPDDLVAQVRFAYKIASKIGLVISPSKTLMYATTPLARKKLAGVLRVNQYPDKVVDSGLSLGVEFQSRSKKVTTIRDERVQACKMKCAKLRVMPWSPSRKASIFVRALLPAMLYGCEFHDMGSDFIRNVRILANSVVWKGWQYMSHFLSPLLSTQTEYEPALWILKRCFLAFARVVCLQPDLARDVWNQCAHRPSKKHTVGPVSVLFAHLGRLGWTMQEDFKVVTQNHGEFALDTVTIGRFEKLLREAWEDFLVPKLQTKQGLESLQTFSIKNSSWHNDDHMLDGFMATLRSGRLFTSRVKSKINPQFGPECQLCGQPDGMHHRVYCCPAVEHIRDALHWETLSQLPKQCLLWGLYPKRSILEEFEAALDRIEATPIPFYEGEEQQHFFTDGSCSVPKATRFTERRAAWSVIKAVPGSAENRTVACGPLPGRKQTSLRAELYAMNAAIAASFDAVIYTDCAAVHRGVPRIIRDGFNLVHWRGNYDLDLWLETARLLSEPRRRIIVQWIPAHRKITDASNLLEMWHIIHNHAADRRAAFNLHAWSMETEQLYARLKLDNEQLDSCKQVSCRLLRGIWDAHHGNGD